MIIGSQSVLAQFPDAPEELVVSLEADVYPRHHPERAELIEGSIGELSMFHRTFGYYADGIDIHLATLMSRRCERAWPQQRWPTTSVHGSRRASMWTQPAEPG